ncbi:mCG115934, partial [Mus musculus]
LLVPRRMERFCQSGITLTQRAIFLCCVIQSKMKTEADETAQWLHVLPALLEDLGLTPGITWPLTTTVPLVPGDPVPSSSLWALHACGA